MPIFGPQIPHKVFGFSILSEDVSAVLLPFGSEEHRKQFLDAVTTKLKVAAESERATLPGALQALMMCAGIVPDVLFQLVTQTSHGLHRQVTVTTAIQTFRAPGLGVAAVAIGFVPDQG